jgi:Tol biopolymer transport system component
MGEDAAQSIPGTEGAMSPVWSPNSEWLGYQTQNEWRRVRIPGGAPETISTIRAYTNGNAGSPAWGTDVILYTGLNGSLAQVPVDGGQPSQATKLDSSANERFHFWPQFLSDGRRFLYVAEGEHTRVYSDVIGGGQRSLVMELPGNGSTIRYVPGYLFYVVDAVLWVQPFDETNLRVTGERRRIVSGVPVAGPGAAPFSVSRTGILAYWTQSLIQQAAQLQWMDRKGNPLDLVGSPAVYDGFDLSRNQSKLASAQVGKDGIELWIQNLAGGGSFPLRISPRATSPILTADGAGLVFLLDGSLSMAEADRTGGSPIRLTERTRNQLAQSWTASGDRLVYENWTEENGIDLMVLHMKEKRIERLPWNTTFNEFGGRLSPNDHWIAYVTDQTGRYEVWVAAFPSGEPRRQVSLAGGSHVDWKGDGSELYFITAEGQLVAVPFSTHNGNIEPGTTTNLFRIPGVIDVVSGSHNIYKAAANGQQFLVAVKSQPSNVPPIRMILNWRELLDVR